MRKKRKTKKRIPIILMVLLLVLGLSLGYASLLSSLNITGITKIDKATWDVHFENLIVSEGSKDSEVNAIIDSTKTAVNYTVKLLLPGDFYEFTVEVVNNGTIDAMVSEILNPGLTEEQLRYLEYTATYIDNTELKPFDSLKVGARRVLKVRVAYKEDITASDLPVTDQALYLTFNTIYVQADENAVDPVYLCKRATTLHSVANTTSETFGNLGTAGILTSGDAYDCDVNGDGIYDSQTERFYYLTDLEENNQYASLIYYKNTDTIQYGDDGPDAAISYLPTISKWSNVSLYNNVRNIKDETGVVVIENFSYEGYAARLLTTKEVEKVCNITIGNQIEGELDSCTYLLENAGYDTGSAYWLESYNSKYPDFGWLAYGGDRNISRSDANHSGGFNDYDGRNYSVTRLNNTNFNNITARKVYIGTTSYGIRPVIEVLKTRIQHELN